MKRFGWILVLLLATSPAWAAKKITVQQLKETLISLQQTKKGDEELSYHPSEQKSLTGDPMSPGTPDGKKPLDIVLSVYSNWRTAVEKQE